MNVLVTGGAGFIGSHFLDLLFADQSELSWSPAETFESGILKTVAFYLELTALDCRIAR